jgi:hypothetical protein
MMIARWTTALNGRSPKHIQRKDMTAEQSYWLMILCMHRQIPDHIARRYNEVFPL